MLRSTTRSWQTPSRICWASVGLWVALSARTASAGPIAHSFQQWSMQRQTRSHVEKPFSHQSGKVELSSPSTLHKFRSMLTWKPKNDPSSFKMVTEPIRLNKGTLYKD